MLEVAIIRSGAASKHRFRVGCVAWKFVILRGPITTLGCVVGQPVTSSSNFTQTNTVSGRKKKKKLVATFIFILIYVMPAVAKKQGPH